MEQPQPIPEWSYEIHIMPIDGHGIEASNEKEARVKIAESFYEETGIRLTDKEIVNVERMIPGRFT